MPEVKVCIHRGCGKLIPRNAPHSRCPPHAADHEARVKRADVHRKPRDPFYVSPEWRGTRLQILARDEWLCQIRDKGCTIDATEVDHITPRHRGGAPLNPTNLRAACRHCNRSRRNL